MLNIRNYGSLLLLLLFGVIDTDAKPFSKASENLQPRDSTYAIQGIQDGGIQPRLEIRQLASDPVTWNLYLLAIIQYQSIDQEQELSYYQIAGIHGWPLVPWDGVAGSGQSGYCTHTSNLFGPWHRPYLALFEQQVYNAGISIAAEFNTPEYQTAALNLRIPYWDWAMNPPNSGPTFPTVLSDPTTQVTYPNGTTATIPNPLYSYEFHPLTPSDFLNEQTFGVWNNTLRWPTTSDASAVSQDSEVETVFEGNLASFRSQLITMFSNYQAFNTFSNIGSGSTPFGSIENIHNTVHTLIGGNQIVGHMTVVPIAAFDPVFWMHHVNVDRFLAIWQQIYPDTYVDPHVQSGSTYTIAQGSTQDVNSPLTPFHDDTTGDFWTPQSARNISVFGYTYPELASNPSNETLISTFNSLYASPAASTFRRRAITALSLTNITTTIDYILRLNLPITALNKSYSVYVFLGPITATSPSTWAHDPNFIASPAVITSPSMGDIISTTNVHLTDPLKARFATGELSSLDELAVVAYLRENLYWKIQAGGQEIDKTSVQGLTAQTLSVDVIPPKREGGFSTWAKDFTEYTGIGLN